MSKRRISALVACLFAVGALVFVGVGTAKTSKHNATFVACLVTDIGGLNDRGFNHLAYVGLLAAKAKLGAPFTRSSRRAGPTTSRTSRPA